MADQTNTAPQQSTEIATIERPDALAQLTPNQLDPTQKRNSFWSSLNPQTARERAQLYNAMTGQVKPLSKVIDNTVLLRDVVLQVVDIANPITGEIKKCVRSVLIDTTGKMYGCVSNGVHKSIIGLIGVNGTPPWTDGIPVIPRSSKAKVGNFYTLEVNEELSSPLALPAPPPLDTESKPAKKSK